MIPSATYRLQLQRDFGFAHARAVAPYLAELGISHVYLSPVTAAVPGSTHGYDVVDPTRLNADLGGEREYRLLTQELKRLGIGQVIDIVPNHMGAATENRWWVDVLRRGEASPYARVYDIDWQASTAGGEPRVLLPVLGDRLERVLERGEITVEVTDDGEPQVRYFEVTLPIAPESLAVLDGGAVEDVRDTVEALAAQGESEEGRARLRALLDAQHYRLEMWRDAKPRVNYRRFFVIDQLIGVRAEDPSVFGVTHALTMRLVNEGAVDGLRVDHVDGLADPAAYLARLREALRAGHGALEATEDRTDPYVVVEKILAEDEGLPETWQCDGTTGYDFMRDVNGVLVDGEQLATLTEVYSTFTGEAQPYEAIAYEARRAVVDGPLSGQLRTVSSTLFEASGAGARGINRDDFDEALRALLASTEVYRTYHTARENDSHARDHIEAARTRAAARLSGGAATALALVSELLAQPSPAVLPTIERLQQVMPTVQAKGIEDSASYRYPRLLSLSEVGTSAGSSGVDVTTFHARNLARQRDWPASMVATATHDHKRGEDARARLDVLSELPHDFAAELTRWSRMTAHARPHGITRLDEYITHQVLLSSWPASGLDESERATFEGRVRDYLVKFEREAGIRTTWDATDEAYETAIARHVAALLDPGVSAEFLREREPVQQRLSSLGAVNSLVQVVLRCVSPGVPDTYQGTEGWDLSFVDPDNRRPVDYEARADALERLRPMLEAPRVEGARELLAAWQSGDVKQFVLATLLRHRRAHASAYRDAEYVPLAVSGALADHVVAFARVGGGLTSVVLTTRLPGAVGEAGDWHPTWQDTRVDLPAGEGTLRDLFTGRTTNSSVIEAGTALDTLPVAVLTSE